MTRGLEALMFSGQILCCLTLYSLDAYEFGLDLMTKEISFNPKTILYLLQMTLSTMGINSYIRFLL